MERDVLRHAPDLVFLDFSANDDIYSADEETLASYEALLRRIVGEAHAPVVQMILPFQENVTNPTTEGMHRRTAHYALSQAYHTAVGDAIALARQRIQSGQATLQQIWPYDGVHPGDLGYALFAEAAWEAFEAGVKRGLVCTVPHTMLYADTYMRSARVRLSTLGPLPAGWHVGRPNLTSAYYDMLMSRWLDDEVIASYAPAPTDPPQSNSRPIPPCASLKVRFNGTMALLFGESTPKSGRFKIYVDGKLVERPGRGGQPPQTEFDAGMIGAPARGNAHLCFTLIQGLPPTDHELEIVPIFSGDTEQEIRLESLCVAGGKATVIR